jgi:hypothetical protein
MLHTLLYYFFSILHDNNIILIIRKKSYEFYQFYTILKIDDQLDNTFQNYLLFIIT